MSELEFDFDKVTPRMLIDFKAKTGKALDDLLKSDGSADLGAMSPEVTAGFIWIALRMQRPDATWDEALDTPLSALSGEVATPDPTNAS